MITISEAAAREVKRRQSSRQKPDTHLRLRVRQGGCAGLFYHLELDETIQLGDRTYQSNGISTLVDAQSYSYVDGLKIDYSEDLMGGGFRFHNPNAVSNCSCGQSFAVKNS
jgi:iron-sulfur cluster assembly accessory protein